MALWAQSLLRASPAESIAAVPAQWLQHLVSLIRNPNWILPIAYCLFNNLMPIAY